MATKTRRELVDQALEELGVLPAGATPSAEDVTTMDGFVETVLDELAERSVCFVGDYETIEGVFFNSLAICLAHAARGKFGVGPLDVETAERKLRIISSSKPTYQPQKSEYY